MPNPDEVATVVVNDRRFDNWETVWIQHRWTEAYPIFRFTTADITEVWDQPPPFNWQLLQFKPGDECAIYLGRWLAITGVITVRQTAYSANQKGVMFQGVGIQWYAHRASVKHKTGNFDGKSWEQVAREVLAPTGVNLVTVGTLNATPFKRLQVEPGETIWNFLERIARPRGIILGSDHYGNMLAIDYHVYEPVTTLIEGVNILQCQAVISIQDIYSEYIMRGQTAASDEQHGPQASEQEAGVSGTAKRYSPLLTTAEQPVWGIGELADRAKNEAIWHEGTIVKATIVVQGWMRPDSGLLWQAGDDVTVYSPMAMLGGVAEDVGGVRRYTMVLKIETATFTQDNEKGTLTTLDLVAPWLLKDQSEWNVNVPGAPQEPGDGKPNTTPPATPPASQNPFQQWPNEIPVPGIGPGGF